MVIRPVRPIVQPVVAQSLIAQLGQALPKDFRGSLPTIEEIEKELEADR